MSPGTFFKQKRWQRLLRLTLVMAILFAAWHVTSHNLDLSGDVNSHENCQVCRLNHVPFTNVPVLSFVVPLLLLSLILVVATSQQSTQSYRYTLGARAPPLF